MKKFFKKLFRRWAMVLVAAWANRTFRKGVRAADERWKKEHRMIYLCSKTFHPDRLVTYNKFQFKAEKSVFGMYHTRLLTLPHLKNHCYYHTPDREGRDEISERDKEIRRRAFVKERLRAAKLIK